MTGGAGFIGSNLVHALNAAGKTDILIVDNLKNSAKFRNLEAARFTDYLDKHAFRRLIASADSTAQPVDAIFHQGACSNTLEDDGAYMMDNNFEYSKEVLRFAIACGAPLVYASTAAVYGAGGPGRFTPTPDNERPLNIYGFSKLVFDNYLRHEIAQGRVPVTSVGLRYFNVYGSREQHKGRMASVMHHFARQIKDTGTIRLFRGSGGYGDGEQRRDFVFAGDVAKVNLYFANRDVVYHGIANVGTGQSRTFNEVAHALIRQFGDARIEYVAFPEDLEGRYQDFTEADLTGLRELGYTEPFAALHEGIAETFTDRR